MKAVDQYQAYRMLKGDCEVLFRILGIVGDISYKWKGEKVGVFLGKHSIGEIVIARERDKELFKLRQETVIFSGNARSLLELARYTVLYEPIPSFPNASRDLSFIVPEGVFYAEIITVLKNASVYCEGIALIDEFHLENGSRSLTMRITLRADDRTLDGDELQKIEENMIDAARKKLGLELRGEEK
jgi:phenylalanyl-tRNA synthetase beta subunit